MYDSYGMSHTARVKFDDCNHPRSHVTGITLQKNFIWIDQENFRFFAFRIRMSCFPTSFFLLPNWLRTLWPITFEYGPTDRQTRVIPSRFAGPRLTYKPGTFAPTSYKIGYFKYSLIQVGCNSSSFGMDQRLASSTYQSGSKYIPYISSACRIGLTGFALSGITCVMMNQRLIFILFIQKNYTLET